MLLRGLRACAESTSKPRTTNLDRISKTTKELLERRRTLRLDPNASHIERQKKILEAARRRMSLKKCRRDLREYNIPLATLLSEDETRTSSRHGNHYGESMNPGTALGPDFISADFLRAGGHPLQVILAAHILPSERKDPRPVEDLANRSP
ncbi:hypothetical protein RB195_019784 [Necator americanus]|uniref:Uncharacterized protein n=1 Tax=Necator americanus TaxID=51031 RepID=A0ABR1CFS2_NECAM